MKKFKSKAFSLIELAVVIIVVGILIAGVTQGGALITKAKYKTAQTLTQSSPVSATPGLRLWLETSLDQSIAEAEASDGTKVTMWYDINPQVSNKLFARTASNTAAILYKVKSAVNGLPSLYFPGASADFFTISTASGSTAATPIPTTSNAFTYFIVLQADSVGSIEDAFYNGTFSSSNGWGYRNSASAKKTFLYNAFTSGTGTPALAKAEVISATSVGGTLGSLRLYVNGVSDATFGGAVTATVASPTGGFYIGSKDLGGSATDNWRGFISEIIIFEKKLSDADRKAIEKYLGTKYNIPVTI